VKPTRNDLLTVLRQGFGMSRYRRMYVPGGTYFFTVNLAQRGGDLLVREIDRLREAVRLTKAERPFHIDAFVVMPDHLHTVWTLPERDADFSVRWSAIKGRFSRDICRAGFTPPAQFPKVVSGEFAGVNPGLRHSKGEVAIWQRRFWEHSIRDAADYEAHVDYCHWNPVKHGFVARAVDWPYSSVHRDLEVER
jgi:putative transposase